MALQIISAGVTLCVSPVRGVGVLSSVGLSVCLSAVLSVPVVSRQRRPNPELCSALSGSKYLLTR